MISNVENINFINNKFDDTLLKTSRFHTGTNGTVHVASMEFHQSELRKPIETTCEMG